jgi:hypothetical protein
VKAATGRCKSRFARRRDLPFATGCKASGVPPERLTIKRGQSPVRNCDFLSGTAI